MLCSFFQDKSSGVKSSKGVIRVNQDMSCDTGRREKIEKEVKEVPSKETKEITYKVRG